MSHEDILFSSPSWLNENRSVQTAIYAINTEAIEFVEKFLNLERFAEYECKASATWTSERGLVHRFEAELGDDVSRSVRTRFEKRVSDFIDHELKLIVYGY